MTWHPDMPMEYRNQIVTGDRLLTKQKGTIGPYLLGPNDDVNQGIYTGDCRELAKVIPDESVDLIFTDPPYLREYLYLYDWLAETAKRVLRPGGFCLPYVAVYWKDRVMAMMGKFLNYYFDLVLVNSGQSPIMWQRKIISRHKSILAYTRDKGTVARTMVLSLWNGGGEDKRYHIWGQDESSARYYTDCFSSVDQVVWDPFAGGGTTPAVCRMLNRNYVAFEIDPTTADNARRRVAETQPPLPGIDEMLQVEMFAGVEVI